jgi:hypothetical protein
MEPTGSIPNRSKCSRRWQLIVVEGQPRAAPPIGLLPVSGQRDELDVMTESGPQPSRDPVAVDVRQPDINQDEIGTQGRVPSRH